MAPGLRPDRQVYWRIYRVKYAPFKEDGQGIHWDNPAGFKGKRLNDISNVVQPFIHIGVGRNAEFLRL